MGAALWGAVGEAARPDDVLPIGAGKINAARIEITAGVETGFAGK